MRTYADGLILAFKKTNIHDPRQHRELMYAVFVLLLCVCVCVLFMRVCSTWAGVLLAKLHVFTGLQRPKTRIQYGTPTCIHTYVPARVCLDVCM